jgi:hypothetical protein
VPRYRATAAGSSMGSSRSLRGISSARRPEVVGSIRLFESSFVHSYIVAILLECLHGSTLGSTRRPPRWCRHQTLLLRPKHPYPCLFLRHCRRCRRRHLLSAPCRPRIFVFSLRGLKTPRQQCCSLFFGARSRSSDDNNS